MASAGEILGRGSGLCPQTWATSLNWIALRQES